MAVILHEQLQPPGEWGLWHITESEDWLRERVKLFPAEATALAGIKGTGRRREFLAARMLLHVMSGRGERGEMYKDSAGKPHLRDTNFHISISHTVNYAAAIAHPRSCGIDVQRIVPRIEVLADRFMNLPELAQLTETDALFQMHHVWAAKEAMYKAFGRRQLDFRQDLRVDLANASGQIVRADVHLHYDLFFRSFPNFVLVGCTERGM